MNGNNIISIMWIDDAIEQHKEDVKNIEHKNKKLKIKLFHPFDFEELFIKGVKKDISADLYLVDYFLDRMIHEGSGEKYKKRGFTIAGMIREQFPECPIYGMTVEDSNKRTGIFASGFFSAESIYDQLLHYEKVQNQGHHILYSDALDYNLIRNTPRGSLKKLLELLNPPDNVMDKIRLVLPKEFKSGLKRGSRGNSIAFAKWVRQVLLSNPGFLYNKLYSATHLGVNIRAFEEISDNFNEAEYLGIFSKTSEDIWWLSKIDDILFSKSKEISNINPWEIAPKVFNISSRRCTKCAVCKERNPEIVGENYYDEEDKRPVHFRCSDPHPQKPIKLYFDEPRVFISEPA